ncbi:MAG TPA: hypothetical protein VF625_03495 [Longimicrobium sp.]|jgi:hypothetical protein
MRRIFLVTLLLLLPRPAAAQEHIRLEPEERIRLIAPKAGIGRARAATVLQMHGDSVLLQVNGLQREVALSQIEGLEISRGTGSRKRGAITGGVIGTVLGAGAAYWVHNSFPRKVGTPVPSCRPPSSGVPISTPGCPVGMKYHDEPYPPAVLAGVAATGTLLGLVIGARFPSDRWERVPLRLATAEDGGVGVGFTMRTR